MKTKIQLFINDIIKVYKKHNLSLSHQDRHGAFEIEEYSKYNVSWLNDADDETGPTKESSDEEV